MYVYTPARSSRIQGQAKFPVIVSSRKIAEQKSIKMALSYKVIICVLSLSLLAIKMEKSHC